MTQLCKVRFSFLRFRTFMACTLVNGCGKMRHLMAIGLCIILSTVFFFFLSTVSFSLLTLWPICARNSIFARHSMTKSEIHLRWRLSMWQLLIFRLMRFYFRHFLLRSARPYVSFICNLFVIYLHLLPVGSTGCLTDFVSSHFFLASYTSTFTFCLSVPTAIKFRTVSHYAKNAWIFALYCFNWNNLRLELDFTPTHELFLEYLNSSLYFENKLCLHFRWRSV